ncbi:uncharacterized protein LACBIDRAFT_315523 [Laccaria bicolor S238N-H82]|uniref:Predicted protein n=1 Tax=Laccaria bicolor (strain S238N-H82 / ATCC MYA-4686) TaxID=486041 RepID=B0D2K6_LACBS|nr:uncharacterized protein LACBIDRAFT_315523 [Laccaria bicolor S238N-H82]EDR11112.1 predicted protein [Laccaria bicolor S238N-H82]|eukprot:XP_001878413.1 predicted protein [Laccaria bicolor S238N-H82]
MLLVTTTACRGYRSCCSRVGRHALFLTRLEAVASNPATAVPAVRAATRGYQPSESIARDLISAIWNVLDRNLDHTAGTVNALVDLLDEEE